jgi:hypothetical protein
MTNPVEQDGVVVPSFDAWMDREWPLWRNDAGSLRVLQWRKVWDAALLAATPQAPAAEASVDAMVDRFLGWPLPDDFAPDAGITFDPVYNKGTQWEARHRPVGTNLLTAIQAKAMFEYVLTPAAGAPTAQQPLDGGANKAGVATGSRNSPPSESVTRGNLPPASSQPEALGELPEPVSSYIDRLGERIRRGMADVRRFGFNGSHDKYMDDLASEVIEYAAALASRPRVDGALVRDLTAEADLAWPPGMPRYLVGSREQRIATLLRRAIAALGEQRG